MFVRLGDVLCSRCCVTYSLLRTCKHDDVLSACMSLCKFLPVCTETSWLRTFASYVSFLLFLSVAFFFFLLLSLLLLPMLRG